MNKNMEQLLSSLLNLKLSDIDDFSSARDENDILHIFVKLKHCNQSFCPVCGSTHVVSNGFYDRTVVINNDLFKCTRVTVRVPRYRCVDCNHSHSDSKFMTPKGKQISYDSIINVMELLKSPTMTFKEVAHITGLSVSTVIRIFDQYCHIPKLSFPEAVCVDEVYAPSSQFKDSNFMCIFYDFYNHTIIDVLPARTKNYLHYYFQPLQHTGELNNVKYIVMDMHRTYKDISKLYMKRAVICADSFHVVKLLNDSLSKLRIRIMKRYDTDSIEYYLLKHFNFLLHDRTINLDNKGKFNKRLNRYINYRELLELILSIDPQLNSAWYLKEKYMIFNISCTYEKAQEQLDQLITEFTLADIPEYRNFTGSLINWRKEIINSFQQYKGRRLNNSVAESINATISKIMFNTKRIKNVERRRKRIMYVINKTGFTIR